MSIHITRYKTENGKTRKVKGNAGKPAGKNGAQALPGADNHGQPAAPAR